MRYTTRRAILFTALFSLAWTDALHAQAAPVATQRTVLRAARLIDGSGAAPIANAVVVIEGDRIKAVGAAGTIALPAGARIIDLGDATLLPGFIDDQLEDITVTERPVLVMKGGVLYKVPPNTRM